MMLYICEIVKIVGAVLVFVIYRYEKSITATFVVLDVLDESDKKGKRTREFWEMFMQALEGYSGLRDINVTVVVFYHKTGKKESLHFAELEKDWKRRISERMFGLFARDWSEVQVVISGYALDNSLDVATDGASSDASGGVFDNVADGVSSDVFDNATDGVSSDAFDSVPDGILDGTIGGVLDSTTNGVSKVIPKRMFIEYWGNLVYDNETGPVVGFDGFI